MEPRQVTRFECARFAREAYNLGVRIIGGIQTFFLPTSFQQQNELMTYSHFLSKKI